MLQTIISGAVLLCMIFMWKLGRRKVPYPPGPPSHPIIGHLLKMPRGSKRNEFFGDCMAKYGDVFRLWLPGRSLIILGSHDVATELLDERGAKYSSRPGFPLFEMMGFHPVLTFLPYGKRFLKHRKLIQSHFSRSATLEYRPVLLKTTRVLLQMLADTPGVPVDYDRALHRFVTSIIIKITFGHEITSEDDPYMALLTPVRYAINNLGTPGMSPIDLFPFLKHFPSWFPGTSRAEFARNNRPVFHKFNNYPYESIVQGMRTGAQQPCVFRTELEAHGIPETEEGVQDIKGMGGTIYAAGTDTTWATLVTFLLLMVTHPEVARQAQDELDNVTGGTRLPDFTDWDDLPYIQCILDETMRRYPPLPLSIPHLSTEDDVYKNMFIPTGSIVFPNTKFAICHDERVYNRPDVFNPSRFLPKPEGDGEPIPQAPWGYGRRVCPGRPLAEATLWIAMASMLAVFDFSKARDLNGCEITPPMDFKIGIIACAVYTLVAFGSSTDQ